MGFLAWMLAAANLLPSAIPKITPATAGPYRVDGNRIVDAQGHTFLIRGTQLPGITADALASSTGFGPFSGTTFITIRQRLNMNAVRLRVDAREYEANGLYRAQVKEIVQRANRYELLAILESLTRDSGEDFWAHCAADFKANPNVFFALPPVNNAGPLVNAIRSAGALQPMIVAGAKHGIRNPNMIHEFSPSYASIQSDRTQLGILSARFAVLVNGLDPQLDRVGGECATFPDDPGAASGLIQDLLNDFDQRSISWTIPAFEPGKFIDDFQGYNWTKLDDGWTCGESPAKAGIAMAVLSHLWRANPHGLFTVNQPAGGLVIARGANASAYGRILAEREVRADRPPWPLKLGNISIRVTDSRGVARFAPLFWVGAGWSSVNLAIPVDSAPGPAEVAVVRSDGSMTTSSIIIADVAPGLWTATQDGRGPVIGQVQQHFADGATTRFPAWKCSTGGCATVPIPLTPEASTSVRIEGTGFRFASSKAAVRVTLDGIPVPVESFGPIPESAGDQVTIKVTDELLGRGEVDLLLIADGVLSNVVRINCGQR